MRLLEGEDCPQDHDPDDAWPISPTLLVVSIATTIHTCRLHMKNQVFASLLVLGRVVLISHCHRIGGVRSCHYCAVRCRDSADTSGEIESCNCIGRNLTQRWP